jgi:hypothetical protein
MTANPTPTDEQAPPRRFTAKQRRHLIIAFLATTIATLCILFGGN